MKYAQGKSFTVPASGGSAKTCGEVGHAMPDAKGRCLRCGARVRYVEYVQGPMPPFEVTIVENAKP